MRRIRTCLMCRKRYATASGSNMCPNCRSCQRDKMNPLDSTNGNECSRETRTFAADNPSEKSVPFHPVHDDVSNNDDKCVSNDLINPCTVVSTSNDRDGIIHPQVFNSEKKLTNMISCDPSTDNNGHSYHQKKNSINTEVTESQTEHEIRKADRNDLVDNRNNGSNINSHNTEISKSPNKSTDKYRETHSSDVGNEITTQKSKRVKYSLLQTPSSNNVTSLVRQISDNNRKKNDCEEINYLRTGNKYHDSRDLKKGTLIDTISYNCNGPFNEHKTVEGVPIPNQTYSKRFESNIAEFEMGFKHTGNELIDITAEDESLHGVNQQKETMSKNDNYTPKAVSSHSADNLSVCFICGGTLSADIKKRVNHLKRCSKKNDVSIRDVQHCDDDAYFISSASKFICNNEHDEIGKWHGHPQHDLSTVHTMTITNKSQPQTLQQRTLGDFFSKTAQTVNDVLMAGAKRVAKVSKIISDHDMKRGQQNPYNKIRGNKGKWNAKKRQYSSSRCPSYKRIIGTDLICDGFRYASKNLSCKYFLTHFHSDHYDGLSKTWNVGIIYCSVSTANLIHQKLGIRKEYIHPLPLNCPTIIEGRAGKPVSVTLIDANHCPGAVMFLFQVGNMNILHVGDFRWDSTKMLRHLPSPKRNRLDYLYLDTTYCDEKYYKMPTQQEAIQATIAVMEKHVLKQPENTTLYLFGSYTIGKEKVYLTAADRFKMKIYVDSTRYRTLSALQWSNDTDDNDIFMNRFTKSKGDSPLWVIPNGHVNFKHLGRYLEEANSGRKVFSSKPLYTHVVGFRPTGWSFSPHVLNKGNILSEKTNKNFTVYGIPYSEHSSFKELVDCLCILKPKKIIPTVSVSKSEEQVELLLNAVARRNQMGP